MCDVPGCKNKDHECTYIQHHLCKKCWETRDTRELKRLLRIKDRDAIKQRIREFHVNGQLELDECLMVED